MKILIAAIAIARALDATTTCLALNHPGSSEGNPFFPSSCKFAISSEAAVSIAQVKSLRKLNVKHPKLTSFIAAATISLESFAVMHNLSVR